MKAARNAPKTLVADGRPPRADGPDTMVFRRASMRIVVMHVGTPGRSACLACGVGASAWAAGRTCRRPRQICPIRPGSRPGRKTLIEASSARSRTPELKLACPDSWLQAASSKLLRWSGFCHYSRGECKNHKNLSYFGKNRYRQHDISEVHLPKNQ